MRFLHKGESCKLDPQYFDILLKGSIVELFNMMGYGNVLYEGEDEIGKLLYCIVELEKDIYVSFMQYIRTEANMGSPHIHFIIVLYDKSVLRTEIIRLIKLYLPQLVDYICTEDDPS